MLIDLNFTLNSKDIMLIAISSQGWCLVHTSHSWLSESSLRCPYCWQSSGVASTTLSRLWIGLPDFNDVTSWKSRPTALPSDNKASRFDQGGQEDIFRWSWKDLETYTQVCGRLLLHSLAGETFTMMNLLVYLLTPLAESELHVAHVDARTRAWRYI